ncbi:hypothetical protein SAMN05519105_1566 [Rhodobacter sp. 24-YEA-8]|nr:hypothetical protein SAMN05519105_1566 [Rhodobacter sp. 24-YEA-8]
MTFALSLYPVMAAFGGVCMAKVRAMTTMVLTRLRCAPFKPGLASATRPLPKKVRPSGNHIALFCAGSDIPDSPVERWAPILQGVGRGQVK